MATDKSRIVQLSQSKAVVVGDDGHGGRRVATKQKRKKQNKTKQYTRTKDREYKRMHLGMIEKVPQTQKKENNDPKLFERRRHDIIHLSILLHIEDVHDSVDAPGL